MAQKPYNEPAPLAGPGLSDFGLSKPSESNSVGEDNPALSDFLKSLSALDDPASRALALQEQRKAIEAQDQTKSTDKLASLILPALIGGGLALGGQGGLGAATALGGLQAPQLLAQEENKARAEALEDVRDREQKSLDRVDAIYNRLNQVYIANPESFIDPETEEPVMSPTLQGWLISGARGVPVHPHTKLVLKQRYSDKNMDFKIKMLEEGLAKANTREQVVALLDGAERATGARFSPAEKQAIAETVGRPEMWDMIRDKMFEKADPWSFTSALAEADERGIRLDSTEFLGLLTYSTSEAAAATGMRDAEWMRTFQKIRRWENDPANFEARNQLIEEHGYLTEGYAKNVAQTVLEDSAEFELYSDGLARFRREDISWSTILNDARYRADAIEYKDVWMERIMTQQPKLTKAQLEEKFYMHIEESMKRWDEVNQQSYITVRLSAARNARDDYYQATGKALPWADAESMWATAESMVREKRKIPAGERPPYARVRAAYEGLLYQRIKEERGD